MSSSPQIPGAATEVANAAWSSTTSRDINEKIRYLGMTPRQQLLNWYYSFFATKQYGNRMYDWDGSKHMEPLDAEAISSRGFIPPGFFDAGAEVPLKFRRPVSPYHLTRVVVKRFTGLLFSERHHPKMRVLGDPDTEDFLDAMIEACRMWATFANARDMGGAVGTTCVGFQFLDGIPVLEVHDPRWTTPRFDPKRKGVVKSIDILRQQEDEVEDPVSGEVSDKLFWYRRIINDTVDIRYDPVMCTDEKPIWSQVPRETVEHGFGFCPVVWVTNTEIQDSIDGDPDCLPIYEMTESIDALTAQAVLSTLANADPTLLITSKTRLGALRKGSDNAIKLEPGDEAKYLELNGSGAKSCMDIRSQLRADALEVVQCVLEHPDTAQTATAVNRQYDSMFAAADGLREQYGQHGVVKLCQMMLKAARKLASPVQLVGGGMEVQKLKLPPRFEEQDDETVKIERKLGPGGQLRIVWPPYTIASVQDASTAAIAAGAASGNGLISKEDAAMFVAPMFGVEDVKAGLAKAKKEQADATEEANQQAMAGMQQYGQDQEQPQ